MGIWKPIKNFFSQFFKYFRDGLEKWLRDNFENARKEALRLLAKEEFTSTHQFATRLWQELTRIYPNAKGTWCTILANLVIDSLKKAGTL